MTKNEASTQDQATPAVIAGQPRFDNSIPWDVIAEIFTDVRSGNAQALETAKKATWVLGCVLETVGQTSTAPGTLSYMPNDLLADRCEAVFKSPRTREQTVELSSGELQTRQIDLVQGVPPEVWAMLIQLLMNLIRERNKR